jgi:hypothetical protein
MGERCDESCDRASAQDVRNKGQGGRDDQELEQVYRLKLNELIDRVENCCKDEDLADNPSRRCGAGWVVALNR